MPVSDKGSERPGRVPYEVSWWQVAMLLVSAHLSLLVSYTPEIAGWRPPVRDAWLAALLAWIPGFLLALVAWWLARRLEGQNLFQMTRTIFGRFLGTLFNIGLVVYLLYWATLLTREFSVFTASVVYIYTPEFLFSLLFLTLGFVGATLQVEFVARAAELSAPFVIGGLLFLVIGTIPHLDLGMLRPMLADSWLGVARQAATPAVVFAEAGLIALLVMPYLNNLKHGPKALGVGFTVNVAFSTAIAAILIGTFGPELLSVLAFPTFSAARLINLGTFLERLEWLLVALWLGAMGVKLSLLLLGARLGVSALFPRARPVYVLLLTTLAVYVGSEFILPTMAHVLDAFVFRLRKAAWSQLTAQATPIVLAAAAIIRRVGAGRS